MPAAGTFTGEVQRGVARLRRSPLQALAVIGTCAVVIALFIGLQTNTGAGALLLVILVFLYFIPTGVAFARGTSLRVGALVVNVFFGWTIIGWVIALVMAVTGSTATTSPSAIPVAVPPTTTPGSTAELLQLTALHDRGALTDAEFAQAKQRLLS
jgi:Superinfection immunity protein/Short C-terminal domain